MPQGIILGPLLFNIYVNDTVTIDTVARFILYVDNTSLFISSETYNDVLAQANSLQQELDKWSDASLPSVNVSKSKAIIFNPKDKNVMVFAKLLYQSSAIISVKRYLHT